LLFTITNTVPACRRKTVESYKVKNGCCEFYKDLKCQEHLFAANNREDKYGPISRGNEINMRLTNDATLERCEKKSGMRYRVSNVITGGVIYARLRGACSTG
jgi:hypothetical protein